MWADNNMKMEMVNGNNIGPENVTEKRSSPSVVSREDGRWGQVGAKLLNHLLLGKIHGFNCPKG